MEVWCSPTPEEIEKDLEEILRELGYLTSEDPPFFSFPVARALLIIIALVLSLLLIYFVTTWISRPSGKIILPRKKKEDILVRKKDYYGLYKRAVALGSKKEYAEAVRILYMALLVFLDSRDVISYHPSLTNYEYRQKVRPHTFSDLFERITHIFDTVFYGGTPATGNDFSQCVEAFTHIQEALS